MRSVQAAVVLHLDDCAVIGAKRLADVKRSRTLGADQYPVASSSSLHLPAQAVALDLDAYAIDDQPCSGRAYADQLTLLVNTVRTHIRHLFEKLGVHDRTEAVERSRAPGLLAPSSRRP